MRAFLAFLESRGGGEVLARDLGAALAADGPVARAALVAEGVIRPCALATTHPCECETLHLGEGDLAQDAIALDAFIAVVTRALQVEAPLAAATSTAAGPEEPVHLGEEIHHGKARDVF